MLPSFLVNPNIQEIDLGKGFIHGRTVEHFRNTTEQECEACLSLVIVVFLGEEVGSLTAKNRHGDLLLTSVLSRSTTAPKKGGAQAYS